MELMRVKIRRRRMNRKRGDNNLLRIRKDKKGWEMDGHVDVDVVRSMEEREWLGAHLWRTLPFSRPTAGNFPVVAGGGEGGDRGEGTLVTFDGMGRPKKGAEKMEWAQAAAAALPIQSTPGVVPIHGGPAWTGSRAERAATCLEAGKTQFRRISSLAVEGLL